MFINIFSRLLTLQAHECSNSIKRLLLFTLLSFLATSPLAVSQDYYWNGGNTSVSPANGGTGIWDTTNAWRVGSATGAQGTWSAGSNPFNAILGGTAGTITVGSNATTNFTGTNMTVNTSGYIITSTSSSRDLVFTGTLSLASGVALTFDMNNTGATWGFGTISFASGSSLRIQGVATASNANRLNLSSAGTISGGSITLAGTGSGPTGFVATTSGVILNTNITNNSSTSATMLGANLSNSSLVYGGVISGSAKLQISAGQSGGPGIVTLTNSSNYTADTYLNHANSGVLRLGITDALPSSTTLFFAQSAGGGTADAGGTLDLAGYSQSIAALDGAGRAVANTGSAATLTIGKASGTNTFSGVIGIPSSTTNLNGANNAITLVKTGNSTQILTGTNTYTGSTAVNGGTLGITTVNALQGTSGITLGFGSTTGTLRYSGGTATLSKNVTVSGNSGNTGAISNTGVGTLTLSGTLTKDGRVLQLSGGAFIVSGQITGLSSNSDLIVDNNAIVTLTNATNNYNGPTIIQNFAKILLAGDYLGAVPAVPTAENLILDNGTLNATSSFTLNSNRGLGLGPTSGSSTGNIQVDSGFTLSYGGVAANRTGGTGGLAVTGSGTLVLSGNSTYSGGTSVTGATLLLSGQTVSQSGTGSGSVQVSTGGTLGGNGRAAGSVSVASGGMITAGTDFTNNILRIGGNLNIDGGTFIVSLFQGSGPDYNASQLLVNGSASIVNNALLVLDVAQVSYSALSDKYPTGQDFQIIQASSNSGSGFTSNNISFKNNNSNGYILEQWTYNSSTGTLNFNPAAVPELSPFWLLTGTTLAVGGLFRRRLLKALAGDQPTQLGA